MNAEMPKTWRKCDHPRVPENIAHVSPRQPRGECRVCRNEGKARYAASELGMLTYERGLINRRGMR